MTMYSVLGWLSIVCALFVQEGWAFSVVNYRQPGHLSHHTPATGAATTTSLDATRRNVVIAAGSMLLSGAPLVAFADFDDLSMPTADEAKKAEEDAMAERIRRKRELQKKASTPASFTENFAKEQEKQKEMSKQSKEERRNALCEELGRGC